MDPKIAWMALFGVGCAAQVPSVEPAAMPAAVVMTATVRPRLVLVTIDGVRWQEIFDGVDVARSRLPAQASSSLLPNLYALGARGVMLRGIAASGPRFVSLPGYRELLTGRRRGGCLDNHCGRLGEPTLFDELGLDGEPATVVGSWETIADAASQDPRTLSISVGRHGGMRDRLRVSPTASALVDEGAASTAFPGHGDYRPDRLTTALALEAMQTSRPRVAWIALGDTDEHAHRGDYRHYLDALVAADRFLGDLMARVDLRDTIVVVTADHGRAAGFADHGVAAESAAVWLVAAGGPIAAGGISTAPHVLADVAPSLRRLLGMPADPSPRAGSVLPELVELTPDRHPQFAYSLGASDTIRSEAHP